MLHQQDDHRLAHPVPQCTHRRPRPLQSSCRSCRGRGCVAIEKLDTITAAQRTMRSVMSAADSSTRQATRNDNKVFASNLSCFPPRAAQKNERAIGAQATR